MHEPRTRSTRRSRSVGELRILGWHSIGRSWHYPVDVEQAVRGFEQQINWIARMCSVLALDEAAERLAAGKPLPPRPLVLTFDDGYADNANVAAEILDRRSLPATFFLVTSFLNGTRQPWWETVCWALSTAGRTSLPWDGCTWNLDQSAERIKLQDHLLDELKAMPFTQRDLAVRELVEMAQPRRDFREGCCMMTWSAAAELRSAGFSIGSHTCNHPNLSRESPEVQMRELEGSKQLIEDHLGASVDALAYPNGRTEDFTDATMSMAASAGYRIAVTVISGRAGRLDSPHAYRRSLVDPIAGCAGLLKMQATDARHRLRATAFGGALADLSRPVRRSLQ